MDTSKYYWMRYASDRATNIKHAQVRIERGTIFGVRELRGKPYDEYLLLDRTRFTLKHQLSDVLMNRAKEYRGTPKLKTAAPVKVKQVIKPAAQPKQKLAKSLHPNDRRYTQMVARAGKFNIRTLKQVMAGLKDDAERVDFKRWALTKVERGSTIHTQVLAVLIGGKKPAPKIVTTKAIKPKQTKITMSKKANSPVKVKLSELELPGEDDFMDHSIPYEFQKYSRVSESSGRNFLSIACQMSISEVDVIPGTMGEFHHIINQDLAPAVKSAKSQIDKAVRVCAAKIKLWAMDNFQKAKRLKKRTDLFEKLVNDPMSAVQQLAHSLLGVPANHTKPQMVIEEEKKLDDLLGSISL